MLQEVPIMSEIGCFSMSIWETSILHFLSGDLVYSLDPAGLCMVVSSVQSPNGSILFQDKYK